MKDNILLIPFLTLLAINFWVSAFVFYPVLTQPWLRHEDIIDTEVEEELQDQAKNFRDQYIKLFDKLCQK